jgi:hypothetical protein
MEKLLFCLEMVDTYTGVGNKGTLMVQYIFKVKKLRYTQIITKEKQSKQWYLFMSLQIMYFAFTPKKWRKNQVFKL